MIRESEVLFVDKWTFGDENEHSYDCDCCDGVAICTRTDPNDTTIPKQIKVTYPTLDEILADEDKCNHILRYCGLYDLKPSGIHYGDVMITYGEITKVLKR